MSTSRQLEPNSKIAGFTGTREGMSEEQRVMLAALLVKLKEKGFWHFWHGDEAHADTEAVRIAQALGYFTRAWPGPDPARRGSHRSDLIESPRPFLDRNKKIAHGCDRLIATPKDKTELLRSGTWATVRYARAANKTVYVIQPDGQVDSEHIYTRPGSIVGRVLSQDIDVRKIK